MQLSAAELLFFELVLHGTAEPVGPNGALDKLEAQRILDRYGLARVTTGGTATTTAVSIALVASLYMLTLIRGG